MGYVGTKNSDALNGEWWGAIEPPIRGNDGGKGTNRLRFILSHALKFHPRNPVEEIHIE